tara:strand:- start:49 stop:336 length:288 start_codon:yes stop_codon:yes gene_type:complete
MKENKLIAEFMGMTYSDPNDNSVMIQMTPQGNEVVPIESMQYHKSWDWLMPVLKKINSEISPNTSGLWRMIINPTEYDIENVYSAVVEFINQYNK